MKRPLCQVMLCNRPIRRACFRLEPMEAIARPRRRHRAQPETELHILMLCGTGNRFACTFCQMTEGCNRPKVQPRGAPALLPIARKCALASAPVPPEIRSRSVGIERGSMTSKTKGATVRSLVATLCTLLLLPGDTLAYISSRSQEAGSPTPTQASKIPSEQLDSLVAPIALYP